MSRKARCYGRGLSLLFLEAVARLSPEPLVRRRLAREGSFARCVAIGKAAGNMAGGCSPLTPRLVISPFPMEDGFQSSHPWLDNRSFEAGQRLLSFLNGPGSTLFLLSGGASALVEVCAPGVDPTDWCQRWAALYRQGLSIVEMNAIRAASSAIKGGRLLDYLKGPSLSLVLSDVLQGARWVGSGLTFREPQPTEHRFEVLADGQSLLQEVASMLPAPCPQEPLLGPIEQAVERIQNWRPAPGEAWLASAEVQVEVRGSGLGGRCQELALRLLPWLEGTPYVLLAAASDGADGPTPSAGAWVDAATAAQARSRGLNAAEYLNRQDSFGFFKALGESWQPGPTGNNLNDVVILLHPECGLGGLAEETAWVKENPRCLFA